MIHLNRSNTQKESPKITSAQLTSCNCSTMDTDSRSLLLIRYVLVMGGDTDIFSVPTTYTARHC